MEGLTTLKPRLAVGSPHGAQAAMKIGLALSGGGFRATLYHLGMVRFLRDAGILPNVTHITAVSGGSIIAAHLCLNWGRYNGSDSEFDAAAAELLSFVRLDVRNRILRRYGLGLAAALAAPSGRTVEPQAHACGPPGVPLQEISLRRHQFVPIAGTPAPAHSRHEHQRRATLFVQSRWLVDDPSRTGARLSDRSIPYRPGHGADGRRRLIRVSRFLSTDGADRSGCWCEKR